MDTPRTVRSRRAQRARPWLALPAALIPLGATSGAGPGDSERAPTLFGFTAQEAPVEESLEQRFDATLKPAELREWMKNLSSAPNQVGSPHDKANAEFVRDLFRQWGWQAQIEEFEVLYPTLKSHTLELVAPTHFTASLNEPPVEGDATSGVAGIMPPYNVYGADGDVTGELVYLNYGMPRDYEDLARRGVDVKGKIVITRYGNGFRGLKPKLAQEHGALGCIIYSDPRADGYAQGDVYPKGGCVRFPCIHAVAITPARQLGSSLLLLLPQPCQPSPKTGSGRPAHRPFRGLLGVHSRYGLDTRRVTVFTDALVTRGFNRFVTSTVAPVASGWSILPGGTLTHWKARLSTAHPGSGPSHSVER